MIQTSNGGYLFGGTITNTSEPSWIQDLAFVKFTDESDMFLTDESSNSSVSPLQSFSILCANSLFRNKSTIRFVLPRQCNVNIVVYNILGQRVRTLVNGEREPGAYEIFWDGTDNRGVNVSNGSYFLRFQAGEYQTTKSMTVIR